MTTMHFSHWAFRLPVVSGFSAITIGNTILFKKEKGQVPQWLIEHELVHVRQIKEKGALKFYTIYAFDYLRNRYSGMNHDTAYRQVRFEKEAYKI